MPPKHSHTHAHTHTHTLTQGSVNGASPRSEETEAQFFARRSRQSGTALNSFGRASVLWAHDIVKWRNHVARNRDPQNWAAVTLAHRNNTWISKRRFSFSNLNNSRTNTRSRIGGVSVRWEAGYIEASEVSSSSPRKKPCITDIWSIPMNQTSLLDRLEALEKPEVILPPSHFATTW